MIKVRPRRPLDVYAPVLDAPLPLLVTCTGMGLPWPSGGADAPSNVSSGLPTADVPLCVGCGGYVDACQCGAPGTPPSEWEPETRQPDGDLFAADDFAHWPTLAERLADSIHDDRAA